MILDECICSLDSSGALLVDLRPVYGEDEGVVRLRSWDDGLAVEHLGPSGWRPDHYAFDIPLACPDWTGGASHPVRRFTEGVPVWALEVARPFRYGQTRLLRVLRAAPRMQDLARDDPHVFWLLSDCLPEGRPAERLKGLAHLRRRDILALALGSGSESMARLLRKLRNPSYEPSDMDLLRRLFGSDLWTRLRHLPRVDWQALKVVGREPRLLNCRCVQNLLSAAQERNAARETSRLRELLQDIRRLARVMRLPAPESRIERLPDLEAVEAYHDSLARTLSRKRRAEVEARYPGPFPPPPLPGDADIVPVATVGELFDEGEAMRHCVASYVERVLWGACAIYRVLAPQRATLEVVILEDGKCRLGQLKLSCNREASAETQARVRRWMAGARERLRAGGV
ncbi:hypothetical protein NNJEOMEG_03164 [Fundidesulfovibrio magnetotacticus]|uniref:PcfJ-like protein n=1 Tax=Fundidesulfovibrio magnetotacticus TaxID=2730080 RepID=A0A6V8M4F5_9BACT|nr:PcfJ domain-containing protein [Fundidesulfovibrio magnetotacticus]GFK95305.1 hypothetical protein NNJEOMEG_03164 [Fundidesulfovibrio magnetotacticus]